MFDLHPLIHELLEQPLSAGTAMQRLIDGHEQERSDGDWTPYRKLPFDEEVERLSRTWFPLVLADDPPARVPVAALNFGLFQPVVQRRTVADFYLSGTVSYEEDGDGDWAVRPAYFPRLRYAGSPILEAIYRLAYAKGGLENDAEESLCLGFVAFAVKAMLAAADPTMIVKSGERIGVAVSWDSGGPLYLGWYCESGFMVRTGVEAIAGIKKQRIAFEAHLRRMGIEPP